VKISNCFIGDNVVIKDNVTIFCTETLKVIQKRFLEASSVIHSGAVIGADGFGFTRCGWHI
jgi:UDP-3-O-[3-hydroxymyristoyl] glucosamine N-acyltransferase